MKTFQICTFISLFSILLFIGSCVRKDAPVPVIDLSDVAKTVTLDLSDLVSDIKIIPLETSEASLIGAERHFIVGEKYIICYSMQNILQFDIEGHFIRCLVNSGKGPDEFMGQIGICIDPDEDNLYFIVQNSSDIQCVDLATGEFKAPVPLAFPANVYSISCLASDQILVIPTLRDTTAGYYLFYQDTHGNMTDHIILDKVPEFKMINSAFTHLIDRDYYYYHNAMVCGDTILKIENFDVKPAFVFTKDDELDFDLDVSEGYYKNLYAVTKDYFIFSRALIKKNGFAISFDETKYYWSAGLKGEPFEISRLNFDLLGKIYEDDEIGFFMHSAEFNSFKNQFIFSMEADTLKDITHSTDNLDLPEDVYQRLKSMDSHLDENDNPVLFVGRLL